MALRLTRPTLALAALALVLPSPGTRPDVAQPITFTAAAAPADRVVAALAQQTGVRLVANPQMARDIVVVRVVDTPLQQLLDRLATATAGKWQADADGTLRLVPDTVGRQAEARAEVRKREDKLREDLKKLSESTDEAEGQATAPDGPTPGPRTWNAATSLLVEQDPDQVVTALTAGRVVFASAPNRMQRPLRGNVKAALDEFIVRHNAQAAALQDALDAASPEERRAMELLGTFSPFGAANLSPIKEPPAKVLLVVSADSTYTGLFAPGAVALQLILFDAQGKVLGTQQATVGEPEGFGLPTGDQEEPTSDAAEPEPPRDPTKIEYSREALEVGKFFVLGEDMLTRPPLPDDIKALLSRPDLHDPLSFTVGESLMAVAKARKTNLVACLPDEMRGVLVAFGSTPPETVGAAEKEFETNRNLALTQEAGWMVVRPAEPEAARRNRQDRVALAALIAAAQAKGLPSLDDMAAYAVKNASPMGATVPLMYLVTFVPTLVSGGMGGVMDWDTLRLWGLLSPETRATLRRGDTVAFGGLDQDASAQLRRILFGSNANLAVRTPESDEPKEPGGFLAMMAEFMPAPVTDFRNEPTEAMPDGMPGDGVISVRITPEAFGVPADPQGRDVSLLGALGAQEIALFQFLSEDPAMSRVGGAMPRLERLRLGKREQLEIRLNVRPDTYSKRRLTDAQIDPKSAPVAMDALPEEFQAQIARSLAKFKEEGFPWSQMGIPGGLRGPRP